MEEGYPNKPATTSEASGSKRFQRLAKSIEASYRELEPFRVMYKKLVKEYAGPMYGHEGAEKKYLNKLQQAVDAYMIMLAANRPQVLVSSDHIELGGFAKHFEVAVNNMLKEIKFERTIRAWVLDAYLCVGIVKTHLADSGLIELENNVAMDPGTPFASNVGLDDWVTDMRSSMLDESTFTGDMYQIPFEDIQEGVEMGMYDAGVAESLQPSKPEQDGDRVDELSRGGEKDAYDFDPIVNLCDIWIPRDRKIYTFIVTDRRRFKINPVPLAVMDWDGPEEGPYFLLSFNDVPGQVMPTSPASHQVWLDQLINNLLRKAAGQANRQKDTPVYAPGDGVSTMQRAMKAKDGQAIVSNDPKSVAILKQGGVDPGNMAFLTNLLEWFDGYAGNLTAMLGLGAQSDTVGQEQLIHSAGSKRGGQMQYRVLEATQQVIVSLGSMLWQDEFKHIAGSIPIEGSPNRAAQSNWSPNDREGDFLQYNFDINVHSMSYQPPAKRAETILMLLAQVYYPAMEMMQQGQGPIDFAELTEILADLLNLPRLRSIFRPLLQNRVDDAPGPQVSKSPVTTRNYVRKSVPSGGTSESRSSLQQQAWLGQAGNQQQGSQMSQPAGV